MNGRCGATKASYQTAGASTSEQNKLRVQCRKHSHYIRYMISTFHTDHCQFSCSANISQCSNCNQCLMSAKHYYQNEPPLMFVKCNTQQQQDNSAVMSDKKRPQDSVLCPGQFAQSYMHSVLKCQIPCPNPRCCVLVLGAVVRQMITHFQQTL